MKMYPCPLSETGSCKYGGNKTFNYGFMSGSSSFCRHPKEKRFTGDIDKCPLEKQTQDPKQIS